MKRIATSLSTDLPPLSLYIDDLEAMSSLVASAGGELTFRSTEYSFDSPDDLRSLKMDAIRSLDISAIKPYLSLELSPSSTRLYVGSDDATSRGVFEGLKSICLKRRRRFVNFITSKWLGFLIGPAIGISINLSNRFFVINYCSVSLVLFLGWAAFSYYNELRNHSLIILSRSGERSSFFKRNADNIILAIASAIIGGIITELVAALIRSLS